MIPISRCAADVHPTALEMSDGSVTSTGRLLVSIPDSRGCAATRSPMSAIPVPIGVFTPVGGRY